MEAENTMTATSGAAESRYFCTSGPSRQARYQMQVVRPTMRSGTARGGETRRGNGSARKWNCTRRESISRRPSRSFVASRPLLSANDSCWKPIDGAGCKQRREGTFCSSFAKGTPLCSLETEGPKKKRGSLSWQGHHFGARVNKWARDSVGKR